MNKEFMTKMMQAKQLEYEALKEVMPEAMVNRITKIENELIDFGKEFFMTMMANTNNDNHSSDTDSKSKARKVTIE